MQRYLVTIFMVIAALTVAYPFEGLAFQDAAARAAAVLAEVRKAIGGEEKLRGVKTVQASGDFRRSMGEMQMEGELELLIEPPDKLRRNETIATPSGATMVRTEVLNGAEVWDDSSQRGGMGGGHMVMMFRGPGGREMSEEQVKEMKLRMRRADLGRYTLGWLLMSDAPATYAGVAEASDGRADVVEVKPAEGPALRLFIDQQTHLPLMLSWQGPQPRMLMRRLPPNATPPEDLGDAPPTTATFELRFDDYRKVDGIQLPHLISRAMNGAVNDEWTVKTYKINAPLKTNTFSR